MEIMIATANAHKIKEINNILKSDSLKITSLLDLDNFEDIPETGSTLVENALIKARYLHSKLGVNVFSEDTGLEIRALDMNPGVLTARYAGEDKNAISNMNKVLNELEGKEDRSGRFRTVIALIYNDKEYLFEGIVEGEIAPQMMGEGGFGYDPIFIPSPYDTSFAQMNMKDKSAISHRGRAMEKLVRFFASEGME